MKRHENGDHLPNDGKVYPIEDWGDLTAEQLASRVGWKVKQITRLHDSEELMGWVDGEGVVRFPPSEYMRLVEGEVEA